MAPRQRRSEYDPDGYWDERVNLYQDRAAKVLREFAAKPRPVSSAYLSEVGAELFDWLTFLSLHGDPSREELLTTVTAVHKEWKEALPNMNDPDVVLTKDGMAITSYIQGYRSLWPSIREKFEDE
ncbi:hypothetical protein CDD82_5110 [Ophiocordyceps australis]|uniref:Uncharacterized protein n=1 Tax=Ophiocordyceps australis TaxID=1399860 RepID=A0A2C5Z2S4_9HYPO|nr:hypothetical protein CDD82_5110 [Ophiocordyceps australis]